MCEWLLSTRNDVVVFCCFGCHRLRNVSKIKSISDTELKTICLRFYDKSVMNLSFFEAEELIYGIRNDTFTSSKPEKNNDAIFNANTAKGKKRLVNCIIALIGLYILSY